MSRARSSALGLALLLGCAVGAARAATKPWLCPPKQFDSVANFNLAKFISAPWYVQSQTPLKYQPKSDLFCVRAKYAPLNAADLTKGVKVCNFANSGAVNGPPMGSCLAPGATPPKGRASFDMMALPWPAARSAPTTRASKLLVGPSSVMTKMSADELAKPPMPGTKRQSGPYWVVAVGPSKNASLGYDWAIITGGAPSNATENDACLPPSSNGDGVWFFSRTPVAPAADLSAMTAAAKALRIDTAKMVPVVQAKCTYAGAAP